MNEKDFTEIYNEFHLKVRQYVGRLVGEHDAEDVTQIVFERVSDKLSGFKAQSKLSTWIFRIATNAALDRLKSLSYKRSVLGPQAPVPLETIENLDVYFDRPASPDQQAIRDEMSQCVREFVDRLPADYRTVLTLNELEGFTNREIAEILQISLDATKIRLHRARAMLRAELEAGCSFYSDDRSELVCDRKEPDQ